MDVCETLVLVLVQEQHPVATLAYSWSGPWELPDYYELDAYNGPVEMLSLNMIVDHRRGLFEALVPEPA